MIWFILDHSDYDFLDVFYVLDNEMKRPTAKELGVVKVTTPISIAVEDKLWKEGKLEEENGTMLVQTVLFLLGVNLGLRGGNEHKHLCRPGFNEQIRVVHDNDRFKCLQFTEDAQGKTHQGGISSVVGKPRVINVYPNYENSDLCPVRLYEKYVSLLLSTK